VREFLTEFLDPELQKRLWQFSIYECWYGHKIYKEDTIVGEYFHTWIDVVCTRVEKELESTLNGPVIDQMYFIVLDDKFCNKNFTHQLYVLALAKMLFKRNQLYFSTSERKYAYMEKIGQITEKVIDIIKGKIAKKVLSNFMGIFIACFVAYGLI
jgi:hypothetical protein